jgi:hypothetical protein
MVVWRDETVPTTYMSSDLEDPTSIPFLGGLGSGDSPYWSYGVWELELTTTYDSGSIRYENTYVIGVYNRSR